MLLDSNIIIYSIKPESETLRALIRERRPAVSAVSFVEVMGYHQLTLQDKSDFEKFFEAAEIHHISPGIILQATELRRTRRMSLGDAIVAATALIHDLTLATRNVRDYQ